MSHTKTTRNLDINKRSKTNIIKNDIYKWTLYILTGLILAFVLLSVVFVIYNGIKTAKEADLSFWYLFFGNTYDTHTYTNILACGFIVFNTIWMAFLAIIIAVPVSIGTAIIITRVLNKTFSSVLYSVVAILAAIPSVVYGVFGYDVVNNILMGFGLPTGSLLAIVLMISFMITPTITIMTIASIKLTDKKMEESSYALGATRTQTALNVTIRSAKAGIITGVIFAVGRALGETTAISIITPVPGNFTEGIVISPWKQSLFLGPAILGAMPGGESNKLVPFYPIISAFLLSTSMLVFGSLKYVEFISNDNKKSNKQTKEVAEINSALKKFEEQGLNSLDAQEQKMLILNNKKMQISKMELSMTDNDKASLELQKATINDFSRIESYKNMKSMQHNLFIYISSLIGVVLLAGILLFLFNGGFHLLSWDLLTARKYFFNDEVKVSIGLYGLAVPMLGTLISILIALSIALPIGATFGLFLGLYVRKDTKFGFFIALVLQIITAIPTIVWSTIALIIFSGTSFDENMKGLEPAIFMGIVILPTIIKTTEDAASRVKNGLIEGSESLGATKLKTTTSIFIRETYTSIIAAALLGISIVMAESTMFISLLKDAPATTDDIGQWVEQGGSTLASTIFNLNSKYNNTFGDPESAALIMDEIKSVGIILMAFIFMISMSSVLFTNKKALMASGMMLSLVTFVLACYFNEISVALSMILLAISFILLVGPMIWEVYKKYQR